jgi:hypothetical protein
LPRLMLTRGAAAALVEGDEVGDPVVVEVVDHDLRRRGGVAEIVAVRELQLAAAVADQRGDLPTIARKNYRVGETVGVEIAEQDRAWFALERRGPRR